MLPTLIAFSLAGGLEGSAGPRHGNGQPTRPADLEEIRRNINDGADRVNDALKKIVAGHDDSIRRWQDRIAQLRADGVRETDPLLVSAKESLARYQQWRVQMSGLRVIKIGK